MDDQTKNLILAFALSLAVIMGWFALFPPPQPDPADTVAQSELIPPPSAETTTPASGDATLAQPLEATARIAIDTPRLTGSLALTGGRFDDMQLRDYRETVAPGSELVHLLNPNGGARHPFYALFGWSPRGALDYDHVPGPATPWQQVGTNALTPETPVTLRWDNGAGLIFTREIAVDDGYMFTVTQTVENTGDTPVQLDPYSILAQHDVPPDMQRYYISHEGLVQMADGRVVCVYGYRVGPSGIRARVSEDCGESWGGEIVLRDDGGSWDLGYPRVIEHEPGRLLAIYYMNRADDPIQMNGGVRHIAQTVFTPD